MVMSKQNLRSIDSEALRTHEDSTIVSGVRFWKKLQHIHITRSTRTMHMVGISSAPKINLVFNTSGTTPTYQFASIASSLVKWYHGKYFSLLLIRAEVLAPADSS